MSTRRWNVVGIFVCLLVLAPVGQARQQATGVVIGGTVTDIGGGVIPGATVALETKDAQPKVLATKITNNEGKFRFENVAPGQDQADHFAAGLQDPFSERQQRCGRQCDQPQESCWRSARFRRRSRSWPAPSWSTRSAPPCPRQCPAQPPASGQRDERRHVSAGRLDSQRLHRQWSSSRAR